MGNSQKPWRCQAAHERDPLAKGPRGSRAAEWLRRLLAPRTAGMSDATPRASWPAMALIAALLALLVVARYQWGFLEHKRWQGIHILIGWIAVAGVLVAFHGWHILRLSRRTWTVLGVAAGVALVFWYFGRSDTYRELFGSPPAEYASLWPLVPFAFFAGCAVLMRLVTPFVLMRAAFGERPSTLGLPMRTRPPFPPAVRGIGWIYLALFGAIFPFIVLASQGLAFQHKYPMAREIIDPEGGMWIVHLLVYEALYALIFVSGESFWRGFITFGLERQLGLYGLCFMLVPYVTGHFGKPLPEALGAIVAGLVLGFLALKHRSVWFGVALHYGVALSMDLLSIGQNGFAIHWGQP